MTPHPGPHTYMCKRQLTDTRIHKHWVNDNNLYVILNEF